MLRTMVIIIISIVLTLVVALCGIALFLQTELGQKWLYDKAIQTLQETLHTRIAVGHVDVSLLRGRMILSNVEIDDRSSEPMLRVDTLEGTLDMSNIWHREVAVKNISLNGATLLLYKEHPDTAANYQFVIDELKKQKERKEGDKDKKTAAFRLVIDTVTAEVSRTHLTWDVRSLPRRERGKFDPAHINLKDLKAQLQCNLADGSAKAFTLCNVVINELNSDMHIAFDKATVSRADSTEQKSSVHGIQNMHIVLDSLRYSYNNHRPRKNKGRPHRGWFDPGHLNMVLSLDAMVHTANKDTLLMTLNHMALDEKESGISIKRMQAEVERYGNNIKLSGTRINLAHTTVGIKNLSAELLSDKTRLFRLTGDSHVSAHVTLTDIARPFAPPLAHFTTPLELTVSVAGDLKRLQFKNVRITTSDRRLSLSCNGDLCNTLEKQRLCLHFNGISMSARGGVKEQIVKHFSKQVRLKMMKQMAAIGDITYNGNVGIYYKREDISGRLGTKYGNVNFAFTLNGNTKYMTGTMSTDAVDLGSIMNIKGLYVGNAKASYSFNVSSKRNKSPNGGRLPQGWLKADVDGAKYKFISFKDIHAEMQSNGTDAMGTVTGKQKFISVVCDFIYHQTDKEQSFRINPHLKLNKKEKKENKKEGKVKDKTDTVKKEKKSIFKRLFSKKKKQEESQ